MKVKAILSSALAAPLKERPGAIVRHAQAIQVLRAKNYTLREIQAHLAKRDVKVSFQGIAAFLRRQKSADATTRPIRAISTDSVSTSKRNQEVSPRKGKLSLLGNAEAEALRISKDTIS